MKAEEVIGRDLREIHMGLGADLARVMEIIDRAGPESSPEFRFEGGRPGEDSVHQARASGVWDKDLNLCGYLLTIVDVTERERARLAVSRLTHDLENQA